MRGKRINEELVKLEIPDFTESSIAWLSNVNMKDWNIFEWGTGASTVWFAKRCNKIWSIEYFKEFSVYMQDYISNANITNCEIRYMAPDLSKDPEYIAKFSSAKGYSFKAFALTINDYPQEMFDMVIVDGRARNRCLNLALSRVKQDGLIIYDDTDRIEYKREVFKLSHHFSEILSFPGKKLTTGKQSETTILRKK
jgi:predicted O-methyltransferase YrrM